MGKNGNGPMIEKLTIFNTQPTIKRLFGSRNLSTILPKIGDTIAYVPPLITNIKPVNTGEILNYSGFKGTENKFMHE